MYDPSGAAFLWSIQYNTIQYNTIQNNYQYTYWMQSVLTRYITNKVSAKVIRIYTVVYGHIWVYKVIYEYIRSYNKKSCIRSYTVLRTYLRSNNIVSSFFNPVAGPQQVRVMRWQKAGGLPRCITVNRIASKSQSTFSESNSWCIPRYTYAYKSVYYTL